MKGFFVLFLCLGNFAFAQTVYQLQGTIGKNSVFFHMEDYTAQQDADNRITNVRYFYTTSLQDIVLEGEKKGSAYNLFLEESGSDIVLERLVIKKVNENSFTGEWSNSKGAKLPVTLKNISVSDIRNPFDDSEFVKELKKKNPYEYARSSFLKFKKDSVATSFGRSIDWYSEKFSKSVMFRLPASFSVKAKEKLNWELFDTHLAESLEKLGCSTSFGYSEGNGIESWTDITYLDQNLLGFRIGSSWFCGGAHPDFGSSGYLYDLNSGAPYDIDDILSFDSSSTTEKKSGFDAYSDYRTNHFAPNLTKLMIQEYKFEKPKEEDDYCDYTDDEFWNFPAWNYTPEGIVFTPSFFRAARSCEDSFLLPFSVLKKFKNSKFPYNFPSK